MAKINLIRSALIAILVVFGAVFGVTIFQVFSQQAEYAVARNEYQQLRDVAGVDEDVVNSPGNIDWDALREINPNVIGWITVPETDISYPIVQGTDNAHYLYHLFSGERHMSGAVFLDYRDNPDFTGQIRIYAHNMFDGSMFAPLYQWRGEYFVIIRPDNTVLELSVTGSYDAELRYVNRHDGITLVTCVNGRPDLRWVIRADN